MAKVVTLGELLLRLSPAGNFRFAQADSFEVNYGGAEANVAVSLSQFGHEVSYVSKVADNAIGDCALKTLKSNGVNCDKVVRGGNRVGIYYLENGASIRPSNVIYDRANSSIAEAVPADFEFEQILAGADLFHITGITPALSDSCAAITLEALKCAKKLGITVSFDLNYRAKLWKEAVAKKQEQMREFMRYVDICFGNARDAAKCMGYTDGNTDFLTGDYGICVNEENMKKVMKQYGFKYLVTTLRESISASDNGWSAKVCDGTNCYISKKYQLHIVDRVGGGDSFVAGFLHGVLAGYPIQKTLEFAVAAAAIKHTIPGDLNQTTVEEVVSLMESDGAGRVVR